MLYNTCIKGSRPSSSLVIDIKPSHIAMYRFIKTQGCKANILKQGQKSYGQYSI